MRGEPEIGQAPAVRSTTQVIPKSGDEEYLKGWHEVKEVHQLLFLHVRITLDPI